MRFRRLSPIGLACFALILSAPVYAQSDAHPVEGTYDVEATGDTIGTIKFLLVLKRDGDKWTGEYRNTPIPIKVNSVKVEGDTNLTMIAASEDTTVTITGKYADGKLTGEWIAGDTKGTWSGTKQKTEAKAAAQPTTPAPASSAPALEGTYDAEIIADGQGALPFTLLIKRDGEKLTTEVPNAGDLTITGITVNGDDVTLMASYQGNAFELPGKRNGSDMSGKWSAGGYSGTWSAKKKK